MRVRHVLLSSAFVSVFFLAGSSPAFADGPIGYGTHVQHCAQTMGFSASMNPSMHHGAASWDGMTCE